MPNAIAVVAHHDDHILWMGGMIQRMKSFGWHWTLIAMCAPDPDRRAYFTRCSDALGVESQSMGFHDYMDGPAFKRNSREKMRDDLVGAIRGKAFDFVFTHSRDPDGEYGFHANHCEVETVVTSLVKSGELGRGPASIAYFSYAAMFTRSATTARSHASYYLQMTYLELQQKCAWCMQAPDVDENLRSLGFPCPNPEAFVGDGLQLPDPETGK